MTDAMKHIYRAMLSQGANVRLLGSHNNAYTISILIGRDNHIFILSPEGVRYRPGMGTVSNRPRFARIG